MPELGQRLVSLDDPGIFDDDPSNVSVYNNTAIRHGATSNGLYSMDAQAAAGHRSRNNLLHDLVSANNSTVGGTTGVTHSKNVHTNNDEEGCPFAGADGACALSLSWLALSANEFRIRASGGARPAVINAGSRFPDTTTAGRRDYVFSDAFGGCRGRSMGATDDAWDIGAHEFGSVACTSSGEPPPPTMINLVTLFPGLHKLEICFPAPTGSVVCGLWFESIFGFILGNHLDSLEGIVKMSGEQ